ncbi:MAG: hypothetical protein LUG86_09745 [Oscillospiraceae bacterium]|nr:hypothetical protein [Oscillospiraceae bacterium]
MKKIKKGDNVRIYQPKGEVIPVFKENTIVDNYTDENGRVYNRSEENILLARDEVDANKK